MSQFAKMPGSKNNPVRRIAVLGAGSGGQTFVAHLRRAPGVEHITLYNRSPGRREAIAARGGSIFARGEVGGPEGAEARVDRLTGDPAGAIRNADLIIITTTQAGIAPLGRAIARAVRPHQTIIIGSGTLGATWELRTALKKGGCQALPATGEFSVLPYAAKLDGGQEGRVWVRSVKHLLFIAFASLEEVPSNLLTWLRQVYPGLTICDDPLQTGLAGANMIVHPSVALSNIEKVEKGEPWRFYADGATPQACALMEALDVERLAIASKCQIELPTFIEYVIDVYPPFDGAQPRNLYQWFRSRMRSKSGRVHMEAVPGPLVLKTRLLEEDILHGLVPLEALGALLDVPTPTVSGLIDKADAIVGTDYRARGRSLQVIGDELRAALAKRGLETG